MGLLVNALICLLAFAGTEGLAWFSHKYIMHGFLWNLHRDHHKGENHKLVQKNDFFFFFLITPGIMCLAGGAIIDITQLICVGAGITAYSITYFLVHEVFIHRRLKWFGNGSNRYFSVIKKAHEIHHQSRSRKGAVSYGMLLVPGVFTAGNADKGKTVSATR